VKRKISSSHGGRTSPPGLAEIERVQFHSGPAFFKPSGGTCTEQAKAGGNGEDRR